MSIQQAVGASSSLPSRVRIPDAVLSQQLANETVLLNLDTGTYFGLDPVGSRMWQLLQEHGQLQRVLAALLEEFDVDEQRCRTDLRQLASTLCSHGLLELVQSAGTSPSQ